MSATPVQPANPLSGRTSSRRLLNNRIAKAWMVASVAIAVIPLVLILAYLVQKGAGSVNWSFLTKAPPSDQSVEGGGYWNGIKGTLKLLVLATVMAVPLGIGTAIYLNEYGRGRGRAARFATIVRFVADLMTGIPSIFIGVFVFALLVQGHGFAAWKGALALALLMVPIITRGAEEVLRLVPRELRDASLALGAPEWRTTLSIVLPAAASGLTTVIMLAVARAAGETAPLLFTSFGNQFVTGWTNLSGADSALPMQIFADANSPYEPAKHRALAGALVLIAIVLVLTIVARFLASRRPSLTRS